MKLFSSTFFALIFTILICGGAVCAENGLSVVPVSATLKIFPDTGAPVPAGAPFVIWAARNEFAPFQLALKSDVPMKNVSVSISDFTGGSSGIPASAAQLLLVETVTIKRPTIGTDRMTWPDPLPPFKPMDLAPGVTRSVWFDLFVPEGTEPGEYEATVSVIPESGPSTRVPVSLMVADVTLPAKRTLKTAFGIGYNQILKAHGVEENSPGAGPLSESYYWFLIDHRLTPYYLPVDFWSDDADRFMNDPRVTFLRAPFSRDRAEMERIAARLKEKGWMDKAVFYMIDELEPSEFPKINETGKYLHSIDPDLKFLMTHGYSPGMEEAGIQIWCPVLMNTIDPTEIALLEKEKKRGKEFWWYTCIGPKWHGMNYFTDEAASAPRLHPWMNYLYGVSGILYWQTTNWSRAGYNPWENTETYPSGNGDGHLIYPGSYVGYNGPVASFRLKMLREGMEDYELLHLLGEKLRQAADELGAEDYDPADRLFEHAYSMIREEGRANILGDRTPYLMFVTTDSGEVDTRREMILSEVASALAEPLVLAATSPRDGGFTNKDTAMVKGYAREGSLVTVNGVPAKTKGNRFVAPVQLRPGENEIIITATLSGSAKTLRRIVFRR